MLAPELFSRTLPLAALMAAAVLAPSPAGAHEVLHELRPGGAVALRAYEASGEATADATYQVWSPADAKRPWQQGRTDRDGWLAFVPAAPGVWRVKVVDRTGHGFDLKLDSAALAPPPPSPPPAPAAAPAVATSAAPPPAAPASPGPGLAFVLRPLLGVLLVGGLFGGLVLLYRKRPGR
jgi:nickel transport protein